MLTVVERYLEVSAGYYIGSILCSIIRRSTNWVAHTFS